MIVDELVVWYGAVVGTDELLNPVEGVEVTIPSVKVPEISLGVEFR